MTSQAQITKWLTDEKYILKERRRETAFAWSFDVANAKAQTIYTCLESAQVPGQIFLECSVKVTETDRRNLAAKTEEEREDLLWQIRFGLLNFDLDMHGTVQPLDIVQVRRVIYSDGLTKNLFFEAAHRVQSGIQLVRWILLRLQPNAAQSSDFEDGLVH